MTATRHMTPEEYGRELARKAPPLTDEQVERAARILATVPEEVDQPEPRGDGDCT